MDLNTLSYYFSIGILSIGILSFIVSRFKHKYIASSVVLAVGTRISYFIYEELIGKIDNILFFFIMIFFIIGIIMTSISILLQNDGRQNGVNEVETAEVKE